MVCHTSHACSSGSEAQVAHKMAKMVALVVVVVALLPCCEDCVSRDLDDYTAGAFRQGRGATWMTTLRCRAGDRIGAGLFLQLITTF